MKKQTLAALAPVVVAAFAVPASAQLIASDSFIVGPGSDTYDDGFGNRIDTNNVIVGTTGFSQPFVSGSANFFTSDITLDVPPATDNYAVGGKGAYGASSFNAFRRAFRELDAYTPVANSGGDYYMSFLMNSGGSFLGSGLTNGYALAGYTNFFDVNAFANVSGSANVFGLQVGYKGDGTGADDGFDVVLRARGLSGDLEDTFISSGVANRDDLLVLKVSPTAAEDQVTYWLNPTQTTSDATLTSTAIASGSVATNSFNTPGDVDRFNVLTANWARSLFFDEPRFAYDIDSLFDNQTMRLPGDANNDGTVSILDFAILRANFGSNMATFDTADFNGDGIVNILDFAILRANFGTSLTPAQLASVDAWYATVVPEPTTLAFAGLAGLGLLRRRRA